MKKSFLLVSMLCCLIGNAWADGDALVTATYGNATGNTTRTMTVALNHATDYVAFQMDLTVPDGTTVSAVTAKTPLVNGGTVDLSSVGGSATESTDFKVEFAQSGTSCRVLGYNLGNTKIGGATGDIMLTVTLTTSEGVAYNANTIAASNVLFVTDALAETTLANATTDSRLWGDVMKDGTVDGKDIQATANLYTGVSNGSATIDKFAADIDSNDTFNGIDIQGVANIYTKGTAK